MEEVKTVSRSNSIIIGGLFAAIMNEIPVINMLNLLQIFFFLGGALGVYYYINRGGELSNGNAFSMGAFAGFIGGGISIMVLGMIKMSLMSEADMQQMVETMARFLQEAGQEVTEDFVREKVLSRMWIARMAGVFISTIAGALGGLACRLYFKRKA